MEDTNKEKAARFPRPSLVVALWLGIIPVVATAPPASGGQMAKQTIEPGQLVPTVGQHLLGPDGSDAGRLWDVLVDRTGQPRDRAGATMGSLGIAVYVGATISTSLAGWTAERFGDSAAFLLLAGAGLAGTLLLWLAMPETRERAATPPSQTPTLATSAA